MTTSPWPRPTRSTLLRITGSLLSLGLLAYLLHQQGWGDIFGTLGRLPWWRQVLLCVAILLSRLLVAGRWHVLLRASGVPIPLRTSVALTFTGLFAGNFLPTTVGGDLVRLAGTTRLHYDGAACAASLVADRVIGLIGMLVVFPLGAQTCRHLIGATPDLPWASASLAGASSSLWQRGGQLGMHLLRALAEVARHPGHALLALALTWGHMLCLFGLIGLVLSGMGEPLPMSTVAGLWSLVYVVTLLPVSINGLGVQELSAIYVFTHFGGVSPAAGVAVSLLMRVLMVFASLPGAVLLPGLLDERQR